VKVAPANEMAASEPQGLITANETTNKKMN